MRTALDLVRDYLSYLPSNATQPAPLRPSGDGPRRVDEMLDLVPADPRRPYDIRGVVELIADDR